jgi:Fe-S cluster assembly protein SufD
MDKETFNPYTTDQKITLPAGVSLVLESLENIAEIELLEGSSLKVVEKIKNTQSQNLNIIQHPYSTLHWLKTITTSYTNDIEIKIFGNQTTTKLNTLILGKAKNSIQINEKITSYGQHNIIEHRTKTVLDNQSSAKIYHTAIAPFQATDPNIDQKIQCILLSKQAKVELKPVLKIATNKIKASHGATIGGIRPEEIFYLSSRGMNTAQAKKTLVKAFCKQF